MNYTKFKYDHPRGKFKVFFDNLQEQIYKHSETGRISCDFFEELKKQINNLSIPEEWKSKYCFENINSRLEHLFEKKTNYRDVSDVPVHEIFEYAQVLLSNYYEQEENRSYKEAKKIFEEIKTRVYRSIGLKAFDEKLGIGDYFVQRVDDKVELIYNLGDGYVATLPLQKQKIEDILNAEDILNQKVTLDAKSASFGKIVPKTSDIDLNSRVEFATHQKMMHLDVSKVLQRAREEYRKNLDKNILNEEEFVKVVEKILTDEDKTDLACALAK